ncbi:MAG: hypothetical protein WAO83_12490 [Fuerstiella sp.]
MLTRDGILFQLRLPFSIFHPPLLIPFCDIQVSPKRWYLFGKSFQLTLTGVNDVRIIIHADLIAWIEQQASWSLNSRQKIGALKIIKIEILKC